MSAAFRRLAAPDLGGLPADILLHLAPFADATAEVLERWADVARPGDGALAAQIVATARAKLGVTDADLAGMRAAAVEEEAILDAPGATSEELTANNLRRLAQQEAAAERDRLSLLRDLFFHEIVDSTTAKYPGVYAALAVFMLERAYPPFVEYDAVTGGLLDPGEESDWLDQFSDLCTAAAPVDDMARLPPARRAKYENAMWALSERSGKPVSECFYVMHEDAQAYIRVKEGPDEVANQELLRNVVEVFMLSPSRADLFFPYVAITARFMRNPVLAGRRAAPEAYPPFVATVGFYVERPADFRAVAHCYAAFEPLHHDPEGEDARWTEPAAALSRADPRVAEELRRLQWPAAYADTPTPMADIVAQSIRTRVYLSREMYDYWLNNELRDWLVGRPTLRASDVEVEVFTKAEYARWQGIFSAGPPTHAQRLEYRAAIDAFKLQIYPDAEYDGGSQRPFVPAALRVPVVLPHFYVRLVFLHHHGVYRKPYEMSSGVWM